METRRQGQEEVPNTDKRGVRLVALSELRHVKVMCNEIVYLLDSVKAIGEGRQHGCVELDRVYREKENSLFRKHLWSNTLEGQSLLNSFECSFFLWMQFCQCDMLKVRPHTGHRGIRNQYQVKEASKNLLKILKGCARNGFFMFLFIQQVVAVRWRPWQKMICGHKDPWRALIFDWVLAHL